MKVHVQVRALSDGRKISVIKNIRHALGIGLVEAKNFVERCDGTGCYFQMKLNDQQLGRLLAYSVVRDQGSIEFHSVEIVEDTPILDYSGLNLS